MANNGPINTRDRSAAAILLDWQPWGLQDTAQINTGERAQRILVWNSYQGIYDSINVMSPESPGLKQT